MEGIVVRQGRPRSVEPRLDEIRLAVERAFQAGVTWVEIATIFEGCRYSVEHRISMLDSQSP